ncbi:MAG: hypothetical protein ABR973_01295 [Candidatus Acidiferrales bacterium]|jgi:hypothetical protein
MWFRWTAMLWLTFWFAAYWRTWGPANFLHFCDIAVILGCIGVASNSALLISSQAVASLLVDTTWALDVAWKLLFGRHLIGGTEYLWDAHYPLWARLLSLFHLVMPVLMLWALHRLGYDRRGLPLQLGIALAGFIASRFTSPAENMNYAFADPFFHRAWGPAPVHIAVIFLFMLFAVYLPTHLLLKRLFQPPQLGHAAGQNI